MNTEATVSVVIPVLHDLESLARLLDDFRSANVQPHEMLVIDGGNDDNCAILAFQHDCVYLRTRPGRGHQLHTGANCATGEVIWFLHADSHPPVSGIASIRREIAAGLWER